MKLLHSLVVVAGSLPLLPLGAGAVLVSASVTEVNDPNGLPLPAGTAAALVIDLNGDGLQPLIESTVTLDSFNDGTSLFGLDLVVSLTSSDELFGITEIDFPPVDVDTAGPANLGDQYFIVWFFGTDTGSPGIDPGAISFDLADVSCQWVTADTWQVGAVGNGTGELTFGQISGQGHVPEPSHLVLLLGAAFVALGKRRRR